VSVLLEGQSVLLTGASGGIGTAIAKALHDRGAALIVSGRNSAALTALRSELGERVEVFSADLAKKADVTRLAARASAVDVLIANAALPGSGAIETFSAREVDRAIDVNLRAPIQLARALAPAMAQRGRGHLVFISSISGKVASAGGSIYSATKFGLRGFALGLREDLHGTGVGVTTVFPGFISGAGMWADTGLTLRRGVGLRTPEQVAEAVLRGLERNRAEIDVAPVAMRAAALAAGVAPSMIAALQRRLGSREIAAALASAQRSKR